MSRRRLALFVIVAAVLIVAAVVTTIAVRRCDGSADERHRDSNFARPTEPDRWAGVHVGVNASLDELPWVAMIAAEPVVDAPPEGLLGTVHPVQPVVLSPAGTWAVLCQAREDTNGDGDIRVKVNNHGGFYGDAMRPYLIVRSGPGERIDAYVAHDPSGRFVAVIADGQLVLVDAVTAARTALGTVATGRQRHDPLMGVPLASFDDAGLRMAYVRRQDERNVAVLRDLWTGDERVIDHGEGLLFRPVLYHLWLVLEVVAEDTDGNGSIELPKSRTSLARRQCRGEASSYWAGGQSGDAVEHRVVPVEGGPVQVVAGLVRPFGEGLLRRNGEGALLLTIGDWTAELVEESCDPWVREVDPVRGVVVITCGDVDSGPSIELRGPGREPELLGGVGRPVRPRDRWRRPPSRLIGGVGDRLPIIDLETGERPWDGGYVLNTFNVTNRGCKPTYGMGGPDRWLLRSLDGRSFEIAEPLHGITPTGAYLVGPIECACDGWVEGGDGGACLAPKWGYCGPLHWRTFPSAAALQRELDGVDECKSAIYKRHGWGRTGKAHRHLGSQTCAPAAGWRQRVAHELGDLEVPERCQ